MRQWILKRALVIILFATLPGFFQCHKKDSTSPGQGSSGPPDQLSGYLYMITRKPTQLIHYSLYGESFNTMIDPSVDFLDAAISGNGKMFCYAVDETTLVVSDISHSIFQEYHLTYPILKSPITMNEKGDMVAYIGLYQNQTALVFYFPEDRRNQVIAYSEAGDYHFFSPLFSRYGNFIAVSSDSGLFLGIPPRFELHRLSYLKISATDFSPSNSYFSGGEMIFDINALQIHPGNFGPGILFVNDDQVVFHKDDMKSIVLSDIAGLHQEAIVGENKLIHTYAVSPFGTNLVYIYKQGNKFQLNFLTIETRELKRVVEMPAADSTYISKIMWRGRF